MKKKLLHIGFAVFGITSAVNAATVTVTAGFGTQGLAVTSDGLTSAPSFYVAVGGFSSGVFTQFGLGQIDSAKVNTATGIQATSPSSLNGSVINLFVGNGTSVATSTSWVILRTAANTAFPADVSTSSSATFSATLGSNLVLQDSLAASFTSTPGTLNSVGNGGTITFVPEPSVALLGAVGALGLLRRRRN